MEVKSCFLPDAVDWSTPPAGPPGAEAAVISTLILPVIGSARTLASLLLHIRTGVGVGLRRLLIVFGAAYANF